MKKAIASKELELSTGKIKVRLIDNNTPSWKGTICEVYEPTGLPFFEFKKVYETEVIGVRTDLVAIINEAAIRYLCDKKENERMMTELHAALPD